MIFSVCQAQARAHLPPLIGSHEHAHADHSADAPPSDATSCHDHCWSFTPYPDASKTTSIPDVSPTLLTWLTPRVVTEPSLTKALTYRPPESNSTDPPARLRFQRFLN